MDKKDELELNGWTSLEWGSPKGIAVFFASSALVLAGIGVLLWGIGQLY